jgi:hypothetical protein
MTISKTRPHTFHTRQPFKLDCRRVRQWKWAVANYPLGEISRN